MEQTLERILIEKLEEYKHYSDLEIEFRLGVFQEKKFNTNIPELFFNKILNILKNTKSFVKKNSSYTDFFYGPLRTNDHIKYIKKERLCHYDFTIPNSPFDLRVSFSREIEKECEKSSEETYKRIKNRNSFLYKNWSYDLTVVSMENNSVNTTLREVELEIIDVNANGEYLIKSSIMKIIDLIKMCENEHEKFNFVPMTF